jgi:hypothetical protein
MQAAELPKLAERRRKLCREDERRPFLKVTVDCALRKVNIACSGGAAEPNNIWHHHAG